LHDLTLIKIIVAYFVYTGSFFIRCSKGRTSPVKEDPQRFLTKNSSCNWKSSQASV